MNERLNEIEREISELKEQMKLYDPDSEAYFDIVRKCNELRTEYIRLDVGENL